jgi:L-asparaginase
MKNKTIKLIFTGGTISMARLKKTSKAVISDNQLELINLIENEIMNITLVPYQFSLKPSPAITPDDMFNLAVLCESYLKDPNVDGIVITHGTDTMEETAYFLDLYLDTKKPVVFTGSMRSYSEIGYDGLSNLVSSIRVAASAKSRGKGVLVVMNDEINAATEVTKTHTLALDTFKSLEFGPIGIVEHPNVLYYRDTHYTKYQITPKSINSNIEILKSYSGSSSLILNLLLDHGVSGIILEGLGRGNVPPKMLQGIKRAIDMNVPILLTSRCPKGRVLDSYGYEGGGEQLKKMGVIFTKNLNSQKARIRLMLVLGITKDVDEIKKYFR